MRWEEDPVWPSEEVFQHGGNDNCETKDAWLIYYAHLSQTWGTQPAAGSVLRVTTVSVGHI